MACGSHVPDPEGGAKRRAVRVIDWDEPANNDFLLAQQFWVTGEMYTRRADLVGFVNGLPLVFIELKAPTSRLETAYDDNLTDYKDTIPHLFWYNALDHPLQRQPEPGRQHDRRLGAFRRVEEDRQRGRGRA